MVGEVLAGRYELEQLVGAGGMSSVFRAHDRVLERTVALKVLHERLVAQGDVVERFRREAKLVAGLSHHNIVAVIDRGEHESRPFIVFEYIAGENLKQLVGRTGPLPVERALELAIQVARGLAFAHEKGFVHRDVKPQNVLLNGDGEAKVTDFGIARALSVQEGETQTGTILGTCDYIAPEQAQGRRVDEHSDVYSLGVVLYELLTGKVPFGGDNFVAVAMQHINAPPPPVTLLRPEVPARVEAVVETALAKDPEQRFATMSAVCDELEVCLEEVRSGDDTSATGILPAVAKPRTSRRRGKAPLLVGAAVAVAAGCVALVLALTRGSSPGGGAGGTGASIPVQGVASYDPYGNNHTENAQLVGNATDGDPATAWSTEIYRYPDGSLGKAGVGLVLATSAPVQLHKLTVTSTTPGFTAEIEAGDSATGPFAVVSQPRTAGRSTTFALTGGVHRYYLVWITNRGKASAVKIDEVTAS